MHADEITINQAQAAALIALHCPQCAHESVTPVQSSATAHNMFRIGEHYAARFPKRTSSVGQVEKEYRFLPYVAPYVSVRVPMPIQMVFPTPECPYPWSICEWIEGDILERVPDLDEAELATDLARFLVALRQLKMERLPTPGAHNFGRGVHLAQRDQATREAIAQIGDEFDTQLLLRSWDRCLAARPYDRPPVLIHGDMATSNILMRDGRLGGIIDWGGLARGDPACDLMIAWSFLEAPEAGLFRLATDSDDCDWLRGLGWALSVAAIQLPYYKNTNLPLAASARATLSRVLAARCFEW